LIEDYFVLLKQLQHKFIVKYLDYFIFEENAYFVMEFIPGQDLKAIIQEKQNRNEKFDEFFIWRIFFQVSAALKYCKELDFVHRNLQPESIIISNTNNCKLVDFGLSKFVESSSENFPQSVAGTYSYIPPEMTARKPYSYETDLWSLGIILYEMSCFCPPFQGITECFLFQNIGESQMIPLSESISKDLLKVIELLLEKESHYQITFEMIEQHPFFKKYHENIEESSAPDEILKIEYDSSTSEEDTQSKSSSSEFEDILMKV
jgi:NIMA (never in mitosis gene a)-related kinase